MSKNSNEVHNLVTGRFGTSFEIKGLTPGTTYHFNVRAIDDSGAESITASTLL